MHYWNDKFTFFTYKGEVSNLRYIDFETRALDGWPDSYLHVAASFPVDKVWAVVYGALSYAALIAMVAGAYLYG